MYNIIISGGRSGRETSRKLLDYLNSPEYQDMLEKIKKAEIYIEKHTESLIHLAKEFNDGTPDIAKLSECAALLNLGAKDSSKSRFSINNPNPAYRHYKRK